VKFSQIKEIEEWSNFLICLIEKTIIFEISNPI
jgi:hypothetical protein